MRLRRYLDRKKITNAEAAAVPRYLLEWLRAHNRPLYIELKQLEDTSPATNGKTA